VGKTETGERDRRRSLGLRERKTKKWFEKFTGKENYPSITQGYGWIVFLYL